MSCGVGCMKFILIFFNVIFLIIGIAGVALGIWIAVDPGSLYNIVDYSPDASTSLVQISSYIFIAACAFVLFVAALGIFGACTQNRCLLGVYAFLVILIFLIEVAALITAIVYDQKFREDIKDEISKQLLKNYDNKKDTSNGFSKAMDEFQRDFECCGIKNSDDYKSNNFSEDWKSDATRIRIEGSDAYPISCYPAPTSTSARYAEGCYEKLRDEIKKYAGVIIGIVVAILVFEICLFAIAICLCRNDEFSEKMV